MRGDVGRVDCRNDHASIRNLRGISAVPPDDSDDPRADMLCVLQGSYEVGTDVFLRIAPSHRVHKHDIVSSHPTYAKPSFEHARPSLIVCARGQLRHVIRRGIGF